MKTSHSSRKWQPKIAKNSGKNKFINKTKNVRCRQKNDRYRAEHVHLYDVLDALDLARELHWCHLPDVLELPDRPSHTHQIQKQQKHGQPWRRVWLAEAGMRGQKLGWPVEPYPATPCFDCFFLFLFIFCSFLSGLIRSGPRSGRFGSESGRFRMSAR